MCMLQYYITVKKLHKSHVRDSSSGNIHVIIITFVVLLLNARSLLVYNDNIIIHELLSDFVFKR